MRKASWGYRREGNSIQFYSTASNQIYVRTDYTPRLALEFVGYLNSR